MGLEESLANGPRHGSCVLAGKKMNKEKD